jgi:Raf kinase inhibitor-like YbhB/YbcL family protein
MPSLRMILPCLAVILPMPAFAAGSFTFNSPSIPHNGKLTHRQVYNGFGCKGENISPPLSWKNAPAGTQSFAITLFDPDAPTGSGWWHWIVVNIPATTSALDEGAGDPSGKRLPEGALQLQTDFGEAGYGGPCPPVGDKPHRYIFTIHALKTPKLEIASDASATLVGTMIRANQLGSAQFTAFYGR